MLNNNGYLCFHIVNVFFHRDYLVFITEVKFVKKRYCFVCHLVVLLFLSKMLCMRGKYKWLEEGMRQNINL